MKKCLPAAAVAVALMAALPAQADDLLTGDVRLACEATLCLSSGERPSECAPSLKRYFSIKHRKLSDTIKGRLNFLKLCPASNEENMPQLVDAIAHGAGRCDAKELNRVMRYTVQVRQCPRYHYSRDLDSCPMVSKTYIRPSKPSYCKAYFEHGWTTAGDAVRYVGEEKNGGKWVDVR